MKDTHGKRHGNIPVGLDLGILPASLPAPATQQHVIREVLSEKNVGGRLHTLVYLGAWLFADSHSDALVLSVCVWGGREGLLYIISKGTVTCRMGSLEAIKRLCNLWVHSTG